MDIGEKNNDIDNKENSLYSSSKNQNLNQNLENGQKDKTNNLETLTESQTEEISNTELPAKEISSNEDKTEILEEQKPIPRLVMTKMVLINFKSYYGRIEIGPFHKSFSSIVGPNGSGKSNVIDALLFVFGYRAKKMRQGKLSELIHNSGGKKQFEFCTVEVYFQEIIDDEKQTDKYEVVPNSELKIARTAYQNNSNKYYINGKLSNFTEVTSLLKLRGVDLEHKRFLILQGEVESIAQMKPKAPNEHEDGLLEYLEDIIGTSVYKSQIQKAESDLENIGIERTERLNRLKIVEKEKDSLEAKKNEAESYIKSENELTRTKNILYQYNINSASNQITNTAELIAKSSAKLDEQKRKYQDIQNQVNDLTKTIEESEKEYNQINIQFEKEVKKREKLESEDIELQEKNKHLTSKIKKLKKLSKDEKKKINEYEKNITNSRENIKTLQKDIKVLSKQLVEEEKKLDQIRDSLKEKTEEFQVQIQQRQNELSPWLEKINNKQSTIDLKLSEYNILKEKADKVEESIETAKKNLNELMFSLDEKKSFKKKSNKKKKDIEAKIAKIENELKSSEEEGKQLKAIYTEKKTKFEEASSSLQAARSNNKVLSFLMEQQDKGAISGIYGRLGNLGIIDDKYDVAVSTACRALNNIVVDTVSTGQQCLDLLRTYNVGRAVIFALDKIPSYNTGKIQTPENAPRLFDLVQCDSKFSNVFYHALRDTLVADNMKQANRLSFGKKRWRVVTLDGKVVDINGSMSGGGTRVERGGMSTKFIDNGYKATDVERFEKEAKEAEKEYYNFKRHQSDYEKELNDLKRDLPNIIFDIEKNEMAIKSIEKQIPDVKKQLSTLNETDKLSDKEIEHMHELSSDIANLNEELGNLQSSASKIEDKIKKLQNKILEVGGDQFRNQKEVVDRINDQIEENNSELTKSEVLIRTSETGLEKSSNILKKNDAELEEAQKNIKELDERIKSNSEDLAKYQEECDKLQDEAIAKKKVFEQHKKEQTKLLSAIEQYRSGEIELQAKIDDYQVTLTKYKDMKKYWIKEISKLVIQDTGLSNFHEDPLKQYTIDELKTYNSNDLKSKIASMEEKLSNQKPNLGVLAEYRQRENEWKERISELENTTNKQNEARISYDELKKRRLDEFMVGFNTISQKLKEMYQMITLGGNAELELVDSLDPFSEGIIFSVMPPKKSWKNISNLSGGEKTLSSLALVFALHHYKPTPLYIMDEIDAALDFRNVSIVANYIKDRTKNAQFIIISLRNNMFELADRLIGIYKTHNCTKTITINPSEILPPVAFLKKKSLLRRASTMTAVTEDNDENHSRIMSTPAATPLRLASRNSINLGNVSTPTKNRLLHRASTDLTSSARKQNLQRTPSINHLPIRKKSTEEQN
ncbi:RecF/RecN/SMC protein [Piromyces finnis]|uniref:Structural maintenance of chromosomes protein n=1 Tax=Piromyces finnis TaxID=1754191 RepID=A0A1Y1VHP9_9FUNG|nr:RecF/RecN/SMC protein [Piromyces finnis]|eukprot:ORX56484.1 RecF/RecN/SMC protein [Piromyces finnis]